MYTVFVEQILPREKQKWTIFTPLLCKWSCYCFLVFNYWCKSTLYMNDVFWLVDARGIALPLLSLFPSNTPSQGYLSFGIPHSVYDLAISIYWSISFMLYSRFKYWVNTCRRNKIDGNKAITPSVRVFTYHNSYMYIPTQVSELIFHIKMLSLYILVLIFTSLWSVTIADILPVGRET